MARYLSVDETAEILRTTDRTVRRMLNDGRLAGSQHMDKGKLVWRVHATKEILQKLETTYKDNGISLEAIDAEEIEDQSEPEASASEQAGNWQEATRKQASGAVDEFWNQIAGKFIERLEVKDQLIGEMRKDLAEKERQLRLLPDLEKQAEEERKATEIKELEAQALRKQIAALKEAAAETELKARRETERLNQLEKLEKEVLPDLQVQLEQEKIQKQAELVRAQEESQKLVEALERTLSENKRLADEELERLRKEKDVQAQAIQEQLQLISSKLEKSQEPWWKKWLTAGGNDKTT